MGKSAKDNAKMLSIIIINFSKNFAIKIYWFEIFLDGPSNLRARAVVQITNTSTLPKFCFEFSRELLLLCLKPGEAVLGTINLPNILNKSLLGRRFHVG